MRERLQAAIGCNSLEGLCQFCWKFGHWGSECLRNYAEGCESVTGVYPGFAADNARRGLVH